MRRRCGGGWRRRWSWGWRSGWGRGRRRSRIGLGWGDPRACQSRLGPFSRVDEDLPEDDALPVVHVEDGDGGAASLRAADEDCPGPVEVPLPRLAARVEQSDHLAG